MGFINTENHGALFHRAWLPKLGGTLRLYL